MSLLERLVLLIIKGKGKEVIAQSKNNKKLQDALKKCDDSVRELHIALKELEKSNREE